MGHRHKMAQVTTRAYQRVDSDIVSEASNNDADLSGNGDQRCVPVSFGGFWVLLFVVQRSFSSEL